MMLRGGSAAARIGGFMSYLRGHGFVLGPGESELALSVLSAGELPEAKAARLALKSLLSGNRDQWSRFDRLFDAYWFDRGSGAAERSAAGSHTPARPDIWSKVLPPGAAAQAVGPSEPGTGLGEAPDGGGARRLIASPSEARSQIDLRMLSAPEEVAEAEQIAERLARAIRDRLSRRRRPARRGAGIDLRRTIRRNLPRGGEPLEIRRKQRPERPVRIVALLDVSGSMALYSRYFLHFLRGLIGGRLHAEAFLFHTRLVRIGDALRERDANRALARLSLIADGFGGGTRIATSLATFNDRYGKEILGSRTIAIVISDGYDTDSPEALAAELARLKRRVRRLVWLNPLLAWKDYAPVARAMAVALDYIDCFAPAHSLASLAALEDEFSRL